jgi:RING-type zinc-finger
MSLEIEPILPRHLLVEKFPDPVNEKDIESLKCPICLEVCAEAVIENKCGHTFCKKCLYRLFGDKNETKCTLSRENITLDQVVPNRAVREMIQQIKVLCVLKCDWKGPFGELEKHLVKECPYVKFKCLNHGCSFISKRKEAEKHAKDCDFRAARCKLCGGYFIANCLGV